MARLEEVTHGTTVKDIVPNALVMLDGQVATSRNVRQPFQREPGFGVSSAHYNAEEQLTRGEEPA